MKISCVHPSCRPTKAVEAHYQWLARASDPQDIEYIFAFDDTKEANDVIYKNFSWIKYVKLLYRLGCVNKLNEAAKLSSGEIIVFASDDVIPEKGWDTKLKECADWSKEVCLDINEGNEEDEKKHKHREFLLKGVILSRSRYLKQKWFNPETKEEENYVLHPEFYHVFADNYYSWCAYRDKCVVKAKHILFEHFHPFYGKGEIDEFYNKANSGDQYDEGLKIIKELKENDDRTI